MQAATMALCPQRVGAYLLARQGRPNGTPELRR